MKIGNKRYYLKKNVKAILIAILCVVGFVLMCVWFNKLIMNDIQVTMNNSKIGYYNYLMNEGE